MIDYRQIDDLRACYLEDSWVLDVIAQPGTLAISLDVVLLPGHPEYQAPLAGERYCYRRGEIKFEGVSVLHWDGQGLPPARDASGEFDYGGIDSFGVDHGVYHIVGNFGEISVWAESLRMKLAFVQE